MGTAAEAFLPERGDEAVMTLPEDPRNLSASLRGEVLGETKDLPESLSLSRGDVLLLGAPPMLLEDSRGLVDTPEARGEVAVADNNPRS